MARVATTVATMDGVGRWIVGVRVADAVLTDAFHDSTVRPEVLGPVHHVMMARVVDAAILTVALPRGVYVLHYLPTHKDVLACADLTCPHQKGSYSLNLSTSASAAAFFAASATSLRYSCSENSRSARSHSLSPGRIVPRPHLFFLSSNTGTV